MGVPHSVQRFVDQARLEAEDTWDRISQMSRLERVGASVATIGMGATVLCTAVAGINTVRSVGYQVAAHSYEDDENDNLARSGMERITEGGEADWRDMASVEAEIGQVGRLDSTRADEARQSAADAAETAAPYALGALVSLVITAGGVRLANQNELQ